MSHRYHKDDLDAGGQMAGSIKKGTSVAAGMAVSAASLALRSKFHEGEDDNVALDGLDSAELLAEKSVRQIKNTTRSKTSEKRAGKNKSSVLRESSDTDGTVFHAGSPDKKPKTSTKEQNGVIGQLNKFYQRRKQKADAIRAAREAKEATAAAGTATAKTAGSVGEQLFSSAKEFFANHNKGIWILLALLVFLLFLMTQLYSCSATLTQALGAINASSWPADDKEITKAENYYTQLEAKLQARIDNVEATNTDCDEFNYNVGEIGHDPTALISYLSAKYGSFTFNNTIKNELNNLYSQQYALSITKRYETRTVTKTVRIGESIGPVVTSGYCNCSICCGSWAGGATASGVYPQANHTIAVDAATPFVPMGAQIKMNGTTYKVEDTGNFARYGVQFDVYYDNHSTASAHGHKTWTAYYAGGCGDSIEVTTTETIKVCYVTLTSFDLSGIMSSSLNTDQKELYDIYMESGGNRQFLGTPVNYDWHYNVSNFYGYRSVSGAVEMHHGLDLVFPVGTEILSPIDGQVTSTGTTADDGKYIVISDDKGYEVKYSHCQTISKSTGTSVTRGETVAKVGSTGSVVTPTLHIEFRYQGDEYNPYFYFEAGDEILLTTGGSRPIGGGSLPGIVLPASPQAARLIQEACTHLGTPYVWGGYSPSGFDCSGFVSYCLTRSGTLNTGHMTCTGLITQVTPIPKSELKPGDLVFFQGTYKAGISHVGIYIGSGEYGAGTFIHCGDPCKFGDLNSTYWIQHWYSGGTWQ